MNNLFGFTLAWGKIDYCYDSGQLYYLGSSHENILANFATYLIINSSCDVLGLGLGVLGAGVYTLIAIVIQLYCQYIT